MIQEFLHHAQPCFYNKHNLINKSLVLTLGLSFFMSSLAGAFVSKAVSDKPLLFVFGALALIASIMMFIEKLLKMNLLKTR